MPYKTISIMCDKCGEEWTQLEDRKEIPKQFTCPVCGYTEAKEVVGAPMVLTASYLDGYNRGPAWEAHKQKTRLRGQLGNGSRENDNEIRKEITSLDKATKGKRDKFE